MHAVPGAEGKGRGWKDTSLCSNPTPSVDCPFHAPTPHSLGWCWQQFLGMKLFLDMALLSCGPRTYRVF